MGERFTAEMYLSYYTSSRGITVDDLGVAPTVIVSWWADLIESMAQAVGAVISPTSYKGKLYSGEISGRPVSLIQVPTGAPGTIMYMEDLIAAGCTTLIGLGYAGSLQEYAPVGSFLLPTTCISREGTSAHYPVGEYVASVGLADRLTESSQQVGALVHSGPHWTTDAIYRELIEDIESYRAQGVLGVDMETSAMYAVGAYRKVEVCNLLVVSDELWHEWRPGFQEHSFRTSVELAKRAVIGCVGNL